MNRQRFLSVASAFALAAVAALGQEPRPPQAAESSLRVLVPNREPQIVSLAEFRTLPHADVTVHNPHSHRDETYSGVPVSTLLAKLGVPFGHELRGSAMALVLVATGSDQYRAALALAELDPDFHPGLVFVADSMNGQPLDAQNGPFKLVVTEDKRPARSVRNLIRLELTSFAESKSAATDSASKEEPKMTRATGTFDVKLAPQTADEYTDGSALGRMTIDKQFHGDLEASSKGQMLTGMSTSVKGSGAYVAIERVTGKLQGRAGSFILYHLGTMDQGKASLSVTVVPDSGTGELVGLTGKMEITIADGRHSYDFDYSLPAGR